MLIRNIYTAIRIEQNYRSYLKGVYSMINKQYFITIAKKQYKTPDLPFIDLPVRDYIENEDRLRKQIYYDLIGYKKHDKHPRCRYFALEYKNRIHHIFNAAYYPIGRMVTRISTAIRGRLSPLYRNNQANIKSGDICIIVNAVDPLLTGKKLRYKNLKYHPNFVGHLKTYSYRHILNHKPQLLYYYLLRKAMPKNTLSEKYLENLRIFRGPTHSYAYLPQFAPDHNSYEYLTQVNLKNQISQNLDYKVIHHSQKANPEEIHGRKFQYVENKKEQINEEQLQDPSKLYDRKPSIKTVPKINKKQYLKLLRKQKKIQYRYKRLHAPYRKQKDTDLGFEYFDDERKARKSPHYKLLEDEDLAEEDQHIISNPFDWIQKNKPLSGRNDE